jgi:Fe-S cluster biogenesis protein NfuA/nitrite reductase/ring-hydroxylating ferredoxin subunit
MHAEDERRRGLEPPDSSQPRTLRSDAGVVHLRVSQSAPVAPNGAAGPTSSSNAVQISVGDDTPRETWVRDIEALEGIVATWGEIERNTVAALERAIDALHKEALTRLIRALKAAPAALPALKQAAADPLVYAVLRHHDLVRASLQERVEAALQSVRPSLESHGGNVELVSITPPDTVSIRLIGSCDGCSSAELTLSAGVERAIREQCPEIQHIERAKHSGSRTSGVRYVSPFAASEESGWVYAAKLVDIPDGGIFPVVIAARSLLLTRTAERVSCFDNACAHLGMPLDLADVSGGVLTCPHHGFQFSIESGECLTVPEVQLQTHAARLRGDDVDVRFS